MRREGRGIFGDISLANGNCRNNRVGEMVRKADLKFLSSLRKVHSKLANCNPLDKHRSKVLIIPGEIDFSFGVSSCTPSNHTAGDRNSLQPCELYNAETYTHIKVPNWLVEGYETVDLSDAIRVIQQWSLKSSGFGFSKKLRDQDNECSNSLQRYQDVIRDSDCIVTPSMRISAGSVTETRRHSLRLPRVVKSCTAFQSLADKPLECESFEQAEPYTHESEIPDSAKISEIFTNQYSNASNSSVQKSSLPINKTEAPCTALKTRQAKENFAKKYILHAKKLSNNGMRKLRNSFKQKVQRICTDTHPKNDGLQLTLKYVCSKQLTDGHSEILHSNSSNENAASPDGKIDWEKKLLFDKIIRKLFDSNGAGFSFKIEKLNSTIANNSNCSICCHRPSNNSKSNSSINLQSPLHNHLHCKKAASKDIVEGKVTDQACASQQHVAPEKACKRNCKAALAAKHPKYPTRHNSKCRNAANCQKRDVENSFCKNPSLDSLGYKYDSNKCQHSQRILHAVCQHDQKAHDLNTSKECLNCLGNKPMASTMNDYTSWRSAKDNWKETAASLNHLMHETYHQAGSNQPYLHTNNCLYSFLNAQPQHIYNIVGSLLNNQEQKIQQNASRKINHFYESGTTP